jgi:signal transduction histidine kinase
LLSQDDLEGGSRQKFISTIHKESLRLTSLLDEILDLSALERRERVWENRLIDVEASLDQAIHVCEALARQNDTQLVSESRASSATVMAEPDRTTQVFINLISNAIKYNDAPRPQVTIRSRIEQGFHVVDIADNGAGVSQDERERIFEKFYRGRLAQPLSLSGVGLGLPISREIVNLMRGTLELVPHQGRGACFRVKLPLTAADLGTSA